MILDCTFRDGGYYVNWDFQPNVVNNYLKAIALSKVDVIEMGFRFISNDNFYGAYGYTTDDHLKSLPLPKKTLIAVMINASDIIEYKDGIKKAINRLFNKKSKSPVHMVRIAAHVKDLKSCKKIITYLNDLGYKVCLNIMQVDKLEKEQITSIARDISKYPTLEALYFADSFGNMDAKKVEITLNAIKEGWKGKIGFHAHNNKGQALSNCLAALKLGIDYVDSTILGMGRGAGNVETENLLLEYSGINKQYKPEPLFDLSTNEFAILKSEYNWGPNIYYHMSAIYGIHPTYIQEMLSDIRYQSKDILKTIKFLKDKESSSYNSTNLELPKQKQKIKFGNLKNIFNNNQVLIIGSGSSIKKYSRSLIKFIEKHRPIVLCINKNEYISDHFINYFVTCSEHRLTIETNLYMNTKKPIILPTNSINSSIINHLKHLKIYNYNLKIADNIFKITNSGCNLPKPLSLFYSISLATAGNAKKIFLAGIDGYDSNNLKQKDLIDMIAKYNSLKNAIQLNALTPTNLPLVQLSIFNPRI